MHAYGNDIMMNSSDKARQAHYAENSAFTHICTRTRVLEFSHIAKSNGIDSQFRIKTLESVSS